jgi:hemerythrin-like domain-containing protein
MTEAETMNMKVSIADGLIGIHRSITRGFTIAEETLQHMVQNTLSDKQSLNGFLEYLRSLVTLVHAHHSTEDRIVFPAFRTKTMEAPYALLGKEHVQMEKLLNEIKLLIEKLAEDKQDMGTIQKLQQLIQALHDLWSPHIEIEQCRFSGSAIGNHMSTEEQQQMAQRVGQHMAENAKPEYLVIPFLFYNLSSQDRKMMQPFLPPNITSLLTTWKDNWAPMKPFFIE